MRTTFDTIIIGGGLVGAAVASGVAAKGHSVAVLDGDDRDFRASRGNFGLVWVQGKGADSPSYAKWTGLAANQFAAFERALRQATGIDIGFQQSGGLDFCLSEEEWDARSEEMQRVRRHTDGAFEYQMLEHDALKNKVPHISNDVLGASFSTRDGHLNPLYLLQALHHRMTSLGCTYIPGQRVVSIDADSSGFTLQTGDSKYTADKIVLCGGLDNQRLAQLLHMHIPVHPIRGQLLITERLKPFLPCPSAQIRQTAEGTVQIGDTHEDVGLDDNATLDAIVFMAQRALRIFPHLQNVRLIRAWGALRVMTPDGLPIYHRSSRYPGAFALSCHSAVTLTAVHAGPVADWICGERPHPLITDFSADRFECSKPLEMRSGG